jgi:hypothetical protein
MIAAALLASMALAGPPWSPPAPVEGAPDAGALLGTAPGGAGLLTFGVPSIHGSRTTAFGAPIDRDGAVGPARRIGRGLSVDALALYGRDRVLVAGTRVGRGAARPVAVAFGRVGEPLGRVRTVVGRAGFPLALDANRTGDAAVIASRCLRAACVRSRPLLIVRRRGRAFGRPVALGGAGRVTAAATSVNREGAVLAVWARDGVVYARVRGAAGGLGRVQRLGAAFGFQEISAALGVGRRAVVAFGAQGIIEGEPTGPFRAWYAYARRGRFGARWWLETVPHSGESTYVAGGRVRAALLPGGHATVAWTGREDGFFVVRVAEVGASGPVAGKTVSLPGRHAILGDMARGPGGDLVVAWIDGIRGAEPVAPGTETVQAAVRRSWSPEFGAVELITAPGPRLDTEGVDVEILPASGRMVATWRQVGEPIHTSVRSR